MYTWVSIGGRLINLDHIQIVDWHDDALYIYILGRSVPEMYRDPDKEMYDALLETIKERKGVR